MATIIIEPSNKTDFQLFVGLAKRMKIKYQLKTDEVAKVKEKDSHKTLENNFYALANSFNLSESADELIEIIETAHVSKKNVATLNIYIQFNGFQG